MAFSYIDLVPPYLLLSIQPSVAGVEDLSELPSFAFGQIFQKSAGSTLTIGTNYCIEGDIKSVTIEGQSYFLVREDNLRFTETEPPLL